MPKRIIDKLRFRVAKSDLKNVGVKPETWRRLRQISTDHEITMNDAIELIMRKAEEAEGTNGRTEKRDTDETT